jgi:hypothetical protein
MFPIDDSNVPELEKCAVFLRDEEFLGFDDELLKLPVV